MARLPSPSARPARRRAGALRALVAATALALVGGVGGTPAAQASVPASTPSTVTTASVAAERSFVASINASRRSAGRAALATTPALTSVARAWAQSMARSQRLAHNPHVWTQVKGWKYLGENVGVGGTPTTLHQAFMNSAPHRANIVSANYSKVGIGVVHSGGRLWVVEVFERPFAATTARPVKATGPGYGSRGPLVRKAQHKLHVRPTGYFGRVTLAKVRAFQQKKHLRVTGRLDAPTRKALRI